MGTIENNINNMISELKTKLKGAEDIRDDMDDFILLMTPNNGTENLDERYG